MFTRQTLSPVCTEKYNPTLVESVFPHRARFLSSYQSAPHRASRQGRRGGCFMSRPSPQTPMLWSPPAERVPQARSNVGFVDRMWLAASLPSLPACDVDVVEMGRSSGHPSPWSPPPQDAQPTAPSDAELEEWIAYYWSVGQVDRAYELGWGGQWERRGGSLVPLLLPPATVQHSPSAWHDAASPARQEGTPPLAPPVRQERAPMESDPTTPNECMHGLAADIESGVPSAEDVGSGAPSAAGFDGTREVSASGISLRLAAAAHEAVKAAGMSVESDAMSDGESEGGGSTLGSHRRVLSSARASRVRSALDLASLPPERSPQGEGGHASGAVCAELIAEWPLGLNAPPSAVCACRAPTASAAMAPASMAAWRQPRSAHAEQDAAQRVNGAMGLATCHHAHAHARTHARTHVPHAHAHAAPTFMPGTSGGGVLRAAAGSDGTAHARNRWQACCLRAVVCVAALAACAVVSALVTLVLWHLGYLGERQSQIGNGLVTTAGTTGGPQEAGSGLG